MFENPCCKGVFMLVVNCHLQMLPAHRQPPFSPCHFPNGRKRCWDVGKRPSKICLATSRNASVGPWDKRKTYFYNRLSKKCTKIARSVQFWWISLLKLFRTQIHGLPQVSRGKVRGRWRVNAPGRRLLWWPRAIFEVGWKKYGCTHLYHYFVENIQQAMARM